jgi:hypothetical protein
MNTCRALDTTRYASGAHALSARITDTSGKVALLADVPIQIAN